MNIAHQTIIGEDGKPQAAIIPWSVFIEIQSLVADDAPTAAELEAIRAAEADRKAGHMESYTDLEDLKVELSL